MSRMDCLEPATLESPGTVIIDDRDPERQAPRTLVFTNPTDILIANSPDDIDAALARIDTLLASGKHLAGYISYDAGLALDKPIRSRHTPSVPLIWLGIYDGYEKRGQFPFPFVLKKGNCPLFSRLNVPDSEYLAYIDRIRDYIAAGDVYQVNYTVKLLFEHAAPAWELFARLRQAHPVGYSAFINTGDMQVISISPELFLRRQGNIVLTRPMKGTARRGRWYEEDTEIARALAGDEKNRAENLMIVDLMRNDIGRVCEMGGVDVPRKFHVERYGSLFQMTSDVTGRLRQNGVSGFEWSGAERKSRNSLPTSELIRAVFPPGSVTGAPKIRALEIIDELEHDSRGVYCGCIGYFAPGGDCLLNVAIRTIVQRGDQCEMGVGSGIVADSEPQSELAETLLKGRFVNSEPLDFDLLETILYRPDSGYASLDDHLARMRNSACYFGRPYDDLALRDALNQTAAEIDARPNQLTAGRARVRLLLSKDGSARAQWSDAGAPVIEPVKLLLVPRRIDPADILLYHKTTRREAFDAEFADARSQGFYDALHVNTRGEVTECSTTNIMAELDGAWYTPPLDSGLLPGIWRAQMLADGKATERVLTLDDLHRAPRIIIGNSVRGPIPVEAIVKR